MTVANPVKPVKMFMGKVNKGADLLNALTGICISNEIHLGRVEAIGAVQKARIGYYNQQKMSYQFLEFDFPLEITHLIGNISVKNNSPMVHAHIGLANEKGQAFGGHLAEGTVIFACEFIIQVFQGPKYCRVFNEETGLPLWDL